MTGGGLPPTQDPTQDPTDAIFAFAEEIEGAIDSDTVALSNRSVKQLKKLWDNIKTERKKELAAAKKERFMTGGGPPPTQDPTQDPTDAIFAFAEEIEGAIDSDTVALSNALASKTELHWQRDCYYSTGESRAADNTKRWIASSQCSLLTAYT
ncbi:hypothetical protein LSTR_LSTR002782 [Laodelphax striatellus]|uniref:Regulatory protein zeste n=1 Tax=Laodelphax striatellus TaxID=195883 RepID=A0A482XIK2_LAOST|nr:hypothetical protein LSTR_LSTR002782 [Laodelphax striatellus]